MSPRWTAKAPLPGGDFAWGRFENEVDEARARWRFLSEEQARRLVAAYGTRLSRRSSARPKDRADLGPAFGPDLTGAEVRYLMAKEWARFPDDILWRRSKLGLTMPAADGSAGGVHDEGLSAYACARRNHASSRMDGLRSSRAEIRRAALSPWPARNWATINVSSHNSRWAWLPPIRASSEIAGSSSRTALSWSPSPNALMPRQSSIAAWPGASLPAASRSSSCDNRVSRASLPINGGDPQRLFIGGHSAGAHLSSLTTVRRDLFAQYGLPQDVIKACLPYSGVYDFRDMVTYGQAAKGGPAEPLFADDNDRTDASPIAFLDGLKTPFFVTWSENDNVLCKAKSPPFVLALREQGVRAEGYMFPLFDHFWIHIDQQNPANLWTRTLRNWMTGDPRTAVVG